MYFGDIIIYKETYFAKKEGSGLDTIQIIFYSKGGNIMNAIRKLFSIFVSLVFMSVLLSTTAFAETAEPKIGAVAGFKPRTIVLYPVVQDASGQLTKLTHLKRTQTESIDNTSYGNHAIFTGANKELMDQIHAEIDGTEYTLYGWYMEVTGYVNCQVTGSKITPDKLVYGWVGGPTDTTSVTYYANRNVKIVSGYCPLPADADMGYVLKLEGKFHYYRGTGYMNPDSMPFRVSVNFWPWK